MIKKISRKYIRLLKLILATGLTAGGLALGTWILVFSRLFTIQQIECEMGVSDPSTGSCGEVILAELEKYRPAKTLGLNTEEIAAGLLKSDRTIKDAQVSIRLPATLKVKLTPRVPVIQITTRAGTDQVLLVDSDGIILEATTIQDELLTLIWPAADSWQIEQVLPPYLHQAIRLAVLADEQFKFQVPPIVESEFSIRGQIEIGPTVLFSLDKEPLSQVKTLQVVLSQAKMDQVREIDLRFKNPVVR